MRSLFTFILIFAIGFNSIGSVVDISEPKPRHFDQRKIEEYKANPEFNYIHESQQSHWWSGFKEWLVEKLSYWFEDKDTEEISKIIYVSFQVLLWLIMISSIGLIIYSLYKKGLFGVIGRKKEELELLYQDLEDKVLETNWNELIIQAIQQKQFNAAIRLLFLQLLQSLNNANQIEWDKAKSIRDYLHELHDQHREGFTSLARYYQYSWFGDVTIDEPHFNEIHHEFKSFNINVNVE